MCMHKGKSEIRKEKSFHNEECRQQKKKKKKK